MPSNEKFVEWLKTQRALPDSKMYRVDLKHFFMSGDCMKLCDVASQIISDKSLKWLVTKVLEFLLSEQYICSDYLPNRWWKVVRGSGMGLRHSSAVADAALTVLAERDFACDPGTLQKHTVTSYARFKDDIFIVASGREEIRKFFRTFHDLASPIFDCEVVELSGSCVEMLAVDVHLKNCEMWTTPKKRYQGPPLSTDSAHPSHVHLSWPVTALKFQMTMCSKIKDKFTIKQQFIQRFRNCFAPAWLIEKLENVQVFQGSIKAKSEVQNSTRSTCSGTQSENVLWMVA